MSSRILLVMLVAIVYGSTILWVEPLFSDTFGTGENQFEIPFVTVGNPGNDAHASHLSVPRDSGSVANVYRIGTYEVSEDMIHKANSATHGLPNPLNITLDSRGPDKPATSVSWFEAARFVNWLNTSLGFSPAYKFVHSSQAPFFEEFALWDSTDIGFDPNNKYRNTLAHYFLPSIDEWYKAAYFDASSGAYFPYPNGKHTPPTNVTSGTNFDTAVYDLSTIAEPSDIIMAGGPSIYGTVGQGGNVYEWQETELNGVNDDPLARRRSRGGNWNSPHIALTTTIANTQLPFVEHPTIGFRVASVPEPRLVPYLMLVLLGTCIRQLQVMRTKDNQNKVFWS